MEEVNFLKQAKPSNNNDTVICANSQPADKNEYITSFLNIFLNLLPNVASSFLFFGVDMIKVHYIGKTKDLILLDALGLGTLFYNIGYFIGAGLTEGMATECSKSYGNKNFQLLALQANQARVTVTSFSLIYAIVNIFLARFILNFLLGSDSPFIDQTLTYIYYTLPAFFMELQYEVYIKLSESQLNYKPCIISLVVALLLSPILCIIFIDYLELGILGCVIVCNVIQLVKLAIMIYTFKFIIKGYDCDFFSKNIYSSNFLPFVKALLLSMAIFFADCAGASVSNVIASTLGKLSYAKFIVLISTAQMFYSLDYGFINTSCLLVGNLVGSNSPKQLNVLINRLILLSLLSAVPLIILLNLIPNVFILFFSENADIVLDGSIYLLIKILSFGAIFDIFQSNLQGVLRGLGILMPTVYSGSFSFFIYLPAVGILLAKILGYDVIGVIVTDLTAYILNGCILYFVLRSTSYEECCDEYHKQSIDIGYSSLDTSPNTVVDI